MYTGEVEVVSEHVSQLLGDVQWDTLSSCLALIKLHRLAEFLLMPKLESSVQTAFSTRVTLDADPDAADLADPRSFLTNLVTHAFEDDTSLSKVKEILTCELVAMNCGLLGGPTRIEDGFLKTLVEQFPELGWRIYQRLRDIVDTQTTLLSLS
jgi:hypothetical protein